MKNEYVDRVCAILKIKQSDIGRQNDDGMLLVRRAVTYCLWLGPARMGMKGIGDLFDTKAQTLYSAVEKHGREIKKSEGVRRVTAMVWVAMYGAWVSPKRTCQHRGMSMSCRQVAAYLGTSHQKIESVQASAVKKIKAAMRREMFGEKEEVSA